MRLQIARWIAFVLLASLLLGLFFAGLKELLPEKATVQIQGYEEWPAEVLEVARGLPVQEGGRVKPLETRAGVAMLQLRGDRSMKVRDGKGEEVRVGQTAWMLDLLFRPELAKQMPSFRVDNSAVIKEFGVDITEKNKRDRYSFAELETVFGEIIRRGGELNQLKARGGELEPVEEQIVELANSLNVYYYLTHYFDFVRDGVVLRGGEWEGKKVPLSNLLAMSDVLKGAMIQEQQAGGLSERFREFLSQLERASMNAKFGFHPIPPTTREREEWYSVGDVVEAVFSGQLENPAQVIEDVQSLEKVHEASVAGFDEFERELAAFKEGTMARAGEEGRRELNLELSYNRAAWLQWAVKVFGVGTLCLLFGLLKPEAKSAKWLRLGVWVTSVLGLVLVLVAIGHRFLILMRPSVTNLYETIPYITAGMVLVALVTELLTKRNLALGVAPVVGMAGAVLAIVFEIASATDAMDPLVAVLRSNFWLTTHVLTITFGYAAGLLGAAVSFTYIFRRVLGLDLADTSSRRVLTRMAYGIVCFTLVLSLIGTILGGIWANYSWGRFWGWDPKENGALMIVLWTLVILHGRVSGLLKEWGVNLATAFMGLVVTFSWFHVNMLGTGLHSYGFTDGKMVVWWFYGAATFVILTGMAYASWEQRQKTAKKNADRAVTGEQVEA